jgi:ATP-dependent Clp protease ATP-binding subunit ClpA
MLERFTSSARVVVEAAYTCARERRDPEITPTHLLLALTQSAADGAQAVLAGLGVDADAVRSRAFPEGDPERQRDAEALSSLGIDLEAVLGRLGPDAAHYGSPRPAPRRLRMSGTARTVMSDSVREAARLGSRAIRSEHLLLGVCASHDPGLGALLADLGVSHEAIRMSTLAALDRAA